MVARRDDLDAFECECECLTSWCEEEFSVDPDDYWHVRRSLHLAVVPRHVEFRLEREIKKRDGWIEIVAPNPESEPPDIEALKHHAEFVRSELEDVRSQLTATVGRIATSLATGALVISLAANVLPQDVSRVGFGLFVIGLVLFVPIVKIALFSAPNIEESFVASGESFPKAMEVWEKDQRRTLGTSPLWIGSYEQWNRIENNQFAMAGHLFPEVHLPEGDYLVVEANRLHLELADVTQRVNRARRVLRGAHGWLSVLVVYLIGVVAYVRLQ